MGDMLSILLECGREGKLLTKEQILYIVDYFKEYFNIDVNVEFDIKDVVHMNYNRNKNVIGINYSNLDNGNCIYSNYDTIFGILHEMRHAMQYKYQDKHQDDLSRLYSLCDFSNIFLSYYEKHHDYFPTEINANMVASYYLMAITYILDDRLYYNIFKDRLQTELNRLESDEYKEVMLYLGCENLHVEDEFISYYEEFMMPNSSEKINSDGLITYC